jgi:hypothetical protein
MVSDGSAAHIVNDHAAVFVGFDEPLGLIRRQRRDAGPLGLGQSVENGHQSDGTQRECIDDDDSPVVG